MVFEGKESRGMARGNVQFAIDGAQVGIDRARANNQDFSSLGIGETSRHQLQHLLLAGAENRGSFRVGRLPGGIPLGCDIQHIADERSHLRERESATLRPCCVECQTAHPRPGEHLFYYQGARNERGEHSAQSSDHRQQRG